MAVQLLIWVLQNALLIAVSRIIIDFKRGILSLELLILLIPSLHANLLLALADVIILQNLCQKPQFRRLLLCNAVVLLLVANHGTVIEPVLVVGGSLLAQHEVVKVHVTRQRLVPQVRL